MEHVLGPYCQGYQKLVEDIYRGKKEKLRENLFFPANLSTFFTTFFPANLSSEYSPHWHLHQANFQFWGQFWMGLDLKNQKWHLTGKFKRHTLASPLLPITSILVQTLTYEDLYYARNILHIQFKHYLQNHNLDPYYY